MGDFIIITLMVSSFWLLWEILRLVGMERLNREEVTLPAGWSFYAVRTLLNSYQSCFPGWQ